MKISIQSKKELLETLQKVNSIVEKRNTLQILSNVFLHAQNDQLIIKATDLEVSIEANVPIKVIEPGRATVSAKNFFDIVREMPEKEIQIVSRENNWVGISCGKSVFNIMGLSPDDFPALPTHSGKGNFHKVNVSAFKKMIDYTLHAVSTDETKYHWNGVYLADTGHGTHQFVSTDGHRLAYFETKLFEEGAPNLAKGIIIPRKGIQEARNIINNLSGTVDFFVDGNHLLLKTPDTFLSIRLIEGLFPDHRQVIPKNHTRSIELDKAAFSDSIRRVSLLANEKSKGIKIAVSTGKLEISSSNPELGEAKETIEISFKGEPLEIGFNAKYLQDALNVIVEPNILLELNDKMSPGVIRLGSTREFLSVLMPMRL